MLILIFGESLGNRISSDTPLCLCHEAMDRQLADSFIRFDVSFQVDGAKPSQSHGLAPLLNVADLKKTAQQALGRRFLRLAASDRRLFDPHDSATFWAARWRQPYSCRPAAKSSCDMVCVCFVVCWS